MVSGYFPFSYGCFLVLPQPSERHTRVFRTPHLYRSFAELQSFDLTKRACKFPKPASPASATGADACIRLYLALQRIRLKRCASRGEELALSARELAA